MSATPSAPESAVATPQSMPPMDPEERAKSIKVSLADLVAKGTALYAQKNYDEAAAIYAQAAEMQAELNGEMNPENADILFLYGRSLFKVGQAKSDVLGGKASAGDEKKEKVTNSAPAKKAQTESSAAAEDDKTEADKTAEGSKLKDGNKVPDDKKPLFQFTGDENFEDSDEEDAGDDEGEGYEEDEDDDLGVAFEILDLARVLFEKTLEQANADQIEEKGEEKAESDPPTLRHVKERLGDTHDLLAEISLENEKYPLAINDSRASLKYKTELYPEESEIIAEAHFKLSLALEFASVTSDPDSKDEGPKTVDQELRDEAAVELDKAIASTKLKLQTKEVDLALIHAPEDNEVTRKQIAEVKEIIADMEQRLVDLRKAPMDVDQVLGADNPMGGILGAAIGESAAEAEARVAEAKKNANDLSGLVRKKQKKAEAPTHAAETNGSKRKAEDPTDGDGNSESSKKVKFEETSTTTAPTT